MNIRPLFPTLIQIPQWVKELKVKSPYLKKIRVDDCICHGELVDHTIVKDRILEEIEKDYCTEESGKSDPNVNYTQLVCDRVSKLDWTKGHDLTRPWVKIFFPNFDITIKNFIKGLGYESYMLDAIWYQQYLEGDTHGWHTHGKTYTGVYYLEFPEGSSRTEVYSPFNFKKHTIKAKEGDLVVFPSHWIHRGPCNPSKRKTIVSFNFEINFGNRASHTK